MSEVPLLALNGPSAQLDGPFSARNGHSAHTRVGTSSEPTFHWWYCAYIQIHFMIDLPVETEAGYGILSE